MENFVFVLAVSCLTSFHWGRNFFFKRSSLDPQARRGLRPLGTVFGLLSLVMLFPLFDLTSSNLFPVSAALMISSMILFWLAVKQFSQKPPAIAFSTVSETSLVCSGPYRWVRHPFYLSYILFWLGCLVAAPGVITMLAFCIMTYFYVRAARLEESAFKLSSASDEYVAYSHRAGMFFPRLLMKRPCSLL